jgi:hypothetical protein
MKKHIILSLILLIAFAQIALSQNLELAQKAPDTQKQNEISSELQKKAVEFLRETSVDVNNLRTLENRISFSAELAGLMWFNDEDEARDMFQNVIGNFRQLLAQYDYQLNALGIEAGEEDFSPFGSSSRSKITRKFAKALGVRQQITMSLAEHDPKLALEFFTETAQAISNPKVRKQIEQQDIDFEARLLNEIAEQDVDIALKYGRKNLSKGINYQTVELLKKIYEKDAEKGVSFGEDIVSAIKLGNLDEDGFAGFYVYDSLIDFGESSLKETKNGKDKPAVFSTQSMRDIAEVLAREILKKDADESMDFMAYMSNIEKYAPARAAQIRTKFALKSEKKGAGSGRRKVDEAISTAASSDDATVEVDESVEEKVMKEVANLGNKELSKEAREETIGKARSIIGGIDDREKKLAALTALAMQVAQLGDKKLASEVLEEAGRLINLQPVNYRDYMEIWMLITAYSNIDAEKSFPLLENTIYRLNDTLAAFVKVGEFIDVQGDMVEDGEVQLGSFGGGMTRELLRGLGSSDTVVRNLAVADFEKMKSITNRFDRHEVRVLAKMLVLRSVLGNLKGEVADVETEEAQDIKEPN